MRAGYVSWLKRRPLHLGVAGLTAHQVRRYLDWPGDRSPVDGDPLVAGDARDWAVRDYKRHLKAVDRSKPTSANLARGRWPRSTRSSGLGGPWRAARPSPLGRRAPSQARAVSPGAISGRESSAPGRPAPRAAASVT
jgi:hypothetical protein